MIMKTSKKVLLLTLLLLIVSGITAQNKKQAYRPLLHNTDKDSRKKHGYYGCVEFGTGVSVGLYGGNIVPQLNFINGYRFNPWLAAGAGFGIRYYFDDGPMMPFFADLHANLLNKKTSPYLSIGAGYAFDPAVVDWGGLLLRSALGVSLRMKNKTDLNLGLTYELQGINEKYDSSYWSYTTNSHITRIEKLTWYYHVTGFQIAIAF
jgi:hypothetical protein